MDLFPMQKQLWLVNNTKCFDLCLCRCDNKNLGLSPMCTINRNDVLNPPIWGENTIQDYLATW